MSVNVGINGFGRVGKGLLRIIETNNSNIQVNAIKDYNNSGVSDEEYVKNMAYLLQNDSVYGKFPTAVDVDGTSLIIDSKKIPVFLERDISSVDWNKLGCDILIESSGTISNINNVKNCLGASVKKIIITRGVENVDFTMLIGVNEELYDQNNHNIISSSTCTGNAISPILNFLDNHYGVNNGFLSTIHPLLSNEKMIDGFHKSFSLGRSHRNIKLTPTSIAKSALAVLPKLRGKLNETSISYRVPTDIVSAVYGVIELNESKKTEDLLFDLSEEIVNGKLNGIVDLCEGVFGHSKVSLDYLADKHSAIIDKNWIMCKENLLSLHVWHDNEFGYCSRVYDIINIVSG